MTTLEEHLASKTPEFREKVRREYSKMALQYALSRLRIEQCLSQREAAEKLQISRSSVSKIERNGEDVKLTALAKYVSALGGKLSLQIDLPQGKKIVVPLTNLEHSET